MGTVWEKMSNFAAFLWAESSVEGSGYNMVRAGCDRTTLGAIDNTPFVIVYFVIAHLL